MFNFYKNSKFLYFCQLCTVISMILNQLMKPRTGNSSDSVLVLRSSGKNPDKDHFCIDKATTKMSEFAKIGNA